MRETLNKINMEMKLSPAVWTVWVWSLNSLEEAKMAANVVQMSRNENPPVGIINDKNDASLLACRSNL